MPSSLSMTDIVPISVAQTNWSALSNLCKEVLGVDPVKKLDEYKIDPKDPAAFVAALGFENHPLQFLRDAKDTSALDHVFMSFAAVTDNWIIELLTRLTSLRLYVKSDRNKCLVIISGTGKEWYEAVRVGCSESVEKEFRTLMTKVFNCFQNTCYREVFSNLNRKSLDDGTIILKG